MPKNSSDRLRAICLALPEAEEVVLRRGPTYRVGDKIFALDRRHEGGAALWYKVPSGSQAILIGADPARFFSPPYYGTKGWIGIRLDAKTDWKEVTRLIRRSFCLIAPKRLAALAQG
ncbi:MAG TPA: MmcQ/YjbR family DNA-binding protein, partial [Stellaceae bacterium]|nr:MmcQ/YjbR family DNA-binding protein [Stellaceae bacterium]